MEQNENRNGRRTRLTPAALRQRIRERRTMLHRLLVPAASLLMIVCALMISDRTSRRQATNAATESLLASAQEQSATLRAVWDGQIETLNAVAISLAESETIDIASALPRMQRLETESSFTHITLSLADGSCLLGDGQTLDVSDRPYFQKAMAGSWAVQRVDDPKTGDGVLIVLAVPIIRDGAVVGAVQGSYTEKLLANLIVPDIYGGEAFSLICREDGLISVDANDSGNIASGQNLLAAIDASLHDKQLSDGIRADIASGATGSVSYWVNGERRYAVYVPLDLYAATGERLVLFNIIPSRLISATAEHRSALNLLLFVMILLSAALPFFLFLYWERKSYRSLLAERDRLHVSEEQNRIAIAAGGINLARYDLQSGTYYSESELLRAFGFGNAIPNVPAAFIDAGIVAPQCVDEYRQFYDQLLRGEPGSVTTALLVPDGGFRWFRADATIVCDDLDQPSQAILVFSDVTDRREQAAVYHKWQQSLTERTPETYTLFRCNLSKGSSFDTASGSLLRICFNPELNTFNERTKEYAGRFVHIDDFDAYSALLNSENLLANYYRGIRTGLLDYRERVTEGEYRWLRVTVETVQYPDSSDVEVFLFYESVQEAKTAERTVREQIDSDPLTGVLNRAAFTKQFNALVTQEQPEAQHALILVDIDGFRRLNDTFGHAVGDQSLVDIAKRLRSAMRDYDFIGRLGGDEFLICMRNVPNQAVVERKAAQIQALMRRAFSVEILLSASIGIAIYPQDGGDFNDLFHSVDLALYAAKANGHDTFAFYNGDLAMPAKAEAKHAKKKAQRRPMLVVDDRPETAELLADVFEDDYGIEACPDGNNVIARLHRYGISLSAVLLRLDIPEFDGFALLDRIRSIEGFRALPIVVLVQLNERDLGLRALEHGASDFVLEPITPELLKTRIDSAVSKAENERLRAQNSYLQMQTGDGSKFRTVFEHTGTVVVEYDWIGGQFTYDPAISEHIGGRFDERPLWQILMSDMIADAMDVKAMQSLVYNLASDRKHSSATLDVMLKTPSREKHWFTLTAFKRVNDLNLTSKIIMTFLDVNEDILASKKLRFQAEHDTLTGLYNRTCFLRLVEKTVRSKPANSYLLLQCDINDFRFINERFGREEGDKLLQYSAEKLLVYADAMNGITGRMSNDMYAVLLPNNPGILDKAVTLIRHFFEDYPLKARITGRAGAYIIADPAMSADSMLDFASTASDAIKGKFAAWLAVYEDSMGEKRLQEKAITDRMEAALAEGQFDIYIQPQYHHATGQIVGAEALVRWIDPQNGIISPGVFIPVFERNGFITQLDEYVWNRTAQHLSRWMAQGNEPVPISVNVSREDTNDPALCQKLLAIVEKHHIPIQLFRLEITESLFAEDTERLISVVEQLHESGFLIEMDDFGSGYSSLNILKDVPVDILKLDMKFFSGEDSLGRGGMIINAVMRMARWLNIPVIAEGVEQQSQADFLLSIGCPTIQGYLYDKPMPVRDFDRKLLENRAMPGIPSNPVVSVLDAKSFWNPASADSQVFNNYIGPAAVFEYHGGEFEIVRMNRRFIKTVGIGETVMLPARGLVHISEDDKPKFKKAVLEVIYSCADGKVDVGCVLDDGSTPVFHVTLRLIAKSSDRAMLFGALDA